MQKKPFVDDLNRGKFVVAVWSSLVILVFAFMTVILFPVLIVNGTPDTQVVEGLSGYVTLSGDGDDIYILRGEWEFYPGRLYTFNDFISGRIDETRVAEYPHYWRDEPNEVIETVGYATYRMRVRVPDSFNGIGIYSRFQYSAYKVYLNDILICSAGVVNEDFSLHKPVYLPMNGYTSASIGSEGRTFSVILHVQNDSNDSGGFSHDIFIGSANAIKDLRTQLIVINGLLSGALVLLFLCLLLIYLSGRERREYLDYTIVALMALFISLTNGGESLMYNTGIDGILITRLEYCAFVNGMFFANYSVIKDLIKSRKIFYAMHIFIAAATVFFMTAPILIASNPVVRIPIISLSASTFILPLLNSFKNTILKHDFSSIISLISYAIVFFGGSFYFLGERPWDSIDILSISILLHCVLQTLIFLHKYNKTEQTLKNMTETLEERIADRTAELTLMKEKAEAATIAKSNFLATMSHEIRTPMNAIMGISDLIRTDNLDSIQQAYLTNIKKSSKALLQIINDILDFSKIEAGKLEVIPVHFNLMAMYDNICSLCKFSADAKDLEFKHSFDNDVPQYVYGDEIRIRQVILNIINNAIKYTKEGYVSYKVKKTILDGRMFLEFIVQDTGIGIKPTDISKLFDPFEQLDSASNRKIVGTGLGLSITKFLVELMKGCISVESEYGTGTEFTVRLPLVEGDKAKVNIQESYIPVEVNNARVLVVDDNSINLTVAKGFLAVHGIIPDTASSGTEALWQISNNPYDLVFMDHMMPEMDGVETTKIIRTMDNGRYRDLPIIALTANAVSGAEKLFKEAGMNGFLSKPIDAALLNSLLTAWLPENKLVNAMPVISDEPELHDKDKLVFKNLSLIESLNVEEGLMHLANNKQAYLRVLKLFCDELSKYTNEIRQCVSDRMWPEYTIKLHAMKGAFANVGENSLSAWAKNLEFASRDGDYELCKSETDSLCDEMMSFREALLAAGVRERTVSPEKTTINATELRQLLEELKSVCMIGDCDSAENIQSKLSQRNYNEKVDTMLDEVFDMVSSFDFELVTEKIEDILALI